MLYIALLLSPLSFRTIDVRIRLVAVGSYQVMTTST